MRYLLNRNGLTSLLFVIIFFKLNIHASATSLPDYDKGDGVKWARNLDLVYGDEKSQVPIPSLIHGELHKVGVALQLIIYANHNTDKNFLVPSVSFIVRSGETNSSYQHIPGGYLNFYGSDEQKATVFISGRYETNDLNKYQKAYRCIAPSIGLTLSKIKILDGSVCAPRGNQKGDGHTEEWFLMSLIEKPQAVTHKLTGIRNTLVTSQHSKPELHSVIFDMHSRYDICSIIQSGILGKKTCRQLMRDELVERSFINKLQDLLKEQYTYPDNGVHLIFRMSSQKEYQENPTDLSKAGSNFRLENISQNYVTLCTRLDSRLSTEIWISYWEKIKNMSNPLPNYDSIFWDWIEEEAYYKNSNAQKETKECLKAWCDQRNQKAHEIINTQRELFTS